MLFNIGHNYYIYATHHNYLVINYITTKFLKKYKNLKINLVISK